MCLIIMDILKSSCFQRNCALHLVRMCRILGHGEPCGNSSLWPQMGLADGSMQGVSTVMTTHSMEECEALCSRIGILHAGRLLCLGSPARLKSIYGSGLFLEVCIAVW